MARSEVQRPRTDAGETVERYDVRDVVTGESLGTHDNEADAVREAQRHTDNGQACDVTTLHVVPIEDSSDAE